MRKKIFTVALVLVTVTSFAIIHYELSEREIAENYSLKFDTRSAEGSFSGLAGTVIFDPNKLEAALIDISIDAKTIDTGNEKKDEHANGEDWLDTEKYPEILFKSSAFKADGDRILVTGELTLHGVTKQVDIPFQYVEESGTFKGGFTVNREEYGIDGGGLKAVFVGDDIDISFNIPTSIKKS